MKFRLRMFDEKAWALHDEVVEAPSPEAAIRQHGKRHTRVIRVESVLRSDAAPHAALASRLAARFSVSRVPRIDIAWWCRELRVLVMAGMTVVEAIETLRLQAGDQARTTLHEQLAQSLAAGRSLSSAMDECRAFPEVLIAGVVASERTGALIEALEGYLRYHEMVDQLRRRLISAALYPMLVAMVGTMVVLFLLWFVVPRFSDTYADLRGSTSVATQGLVFASAVLRDHAIALAWGMVALLGVLAWTLHSDSLLGIIARTVDAVPALRRVHDDLCLAKLYHALALMFRGGFTLPDALQRCCAIGLGKRWSAALVHAHNALDEGWSVSRAFASNGLSDTVAERLLVVGERTGSFERVLQTIADRHASKFATVVERATRLAEPLLLLFVALTVGSVVVMMYLPIFDLASSLG
jgi:general secretion pathway protein F